MKTKILIVIFFSIFSLINSSCKNQIKRYPIYNAPDGVVLDVRNAMMYCYNDSGKYAVTYYEMFKNFDDWGLYSFSWMYHAGDSFSSAGVQDTIRKWRALRPKITK